MRILLPLNLINFGSFSYNTEISIQFVLNDSYSTLVQIINNNVVEKYKKSRPNCKWYLAT